MAAGDSIIGICNMALVALGEDPIGALTDNNKRAIHCALLYDVTRREMLRSHPWNFAKKQAILAAAATPPLFDYAYAYELPADFIRMYDLPVNGDGFLSTSNSQLSRLGVRWDVIGDRLMTDETPPLSVLYIYDHQDPTKFDALFARALADMLASELALPLGRDKAMQQTLTAKVADRLATARFSGSQENSPKEWDVDVLLRSRA